MYDIFIIVEFFLCYNMKDFLFCLYDTYIAQHKDDFLFICFCQVVIFNSLLFLSLLSSILFCYY